MNRFLACAFILSWSCGDHLPGDVYRIDSRPVGATEWHQVAWADTLCDTIVAPHGVPTFYRITHIRQATASGPSNLQCGLSLDWYTGVDALLDSCGQDSAFVAVHLPASTWDVSYVFNDSIPVHVVAQSPFDYNNDGRINLSDFVIFGSTRPTVSDFARFGTVYHKQTRYEW